MNANAKTVVTVETKKQNTQQRKILIPKGPANLLAALVDLLALAAH